MVQDFVHPHDLLCPLISSTFNGANGQIDMAEAPEHIGCCRAASGPSRGCFRPPAECAQLPCGTVGSFKPLAVVFLDTRSDRCKKVGGFPLVESTVYSGIST